jgi:hypothetical protein
MGSSGGVSAPMSMLIVVQEKYEDSFADVFGSREKREVEAGSC